MGLLTWFCKLDITWLRTDRSVDTHSSHMRGLLFYKCGLPWAPGPFAKSDPHCSVYICHHFPLSWAFILLLSQFHLCHHSPTAVFWFQWIANDKLYGSLEMGPQVWDMEIRNCIYSSSHLQTDQCLLLRTIIRSGQLKKVIETKIRTVAWRKTHPLMGH